MLQLKPKAPGDVWYYAFGSNMNPEVLTGRRKVAPKQSVPAKLDGWALAFNYRGVPYVEPGMATVIRVSTSDRVRAQQAEAKAGGPPPLGKNGLPIILTAAAAYRARLSAGLHGVLHLISAAEWEMVKATEGVVLQGLGYQVEPVTCELYDGQKVEALTLVAAPLSTANPAAILPSKRYINLIREGARHHKLDPAYIRMLEAHPAFSPPDNLPQYLGRVAMGAVAMGVAVPFMPLVAASIALQSVRQWWDGKPTGHPAAAPGATAVSLPTQPTTTASSTSNGTPHAGNGAQNGTPSPSSGPAASASADPHTLKTLPLEKTRPPPGMAMFMKLREHIPRPAMAIWMWTCMGTMNASHNYLLKWVLGNGLDNSPSWAEWPTEDKKSQ